MANLGISKRHIYEVKPDRKIAENSSDYYSTPGGGEWEVDLVKVNTDKEKVTSAFVQLGQRPSPKRSWTDKLLELLGRRKLDNRAEATQLLETELDKCRKLTYSTLLKRLDSEASETVELTGATGITYQFELQCFWDDKKQKTIRFVASIDGDDIRANFPISRSFIKAPDGSFVGE